MRILSFRSALLLPGAFTLLMGCGSSTADTNANAMANPGPAGGGVANTGGGGQANGISGSTSGGSGGAVNPSAGSGGVAPAGGTSGAPAGGTGGDPGPVAGAGGAVGGAPQAGAGGEGQGGGGAAGMDDCGQPLPAAPIASLITAQPARYTHTVNGDRPAAVDLRVPTIMGKLVVNLDVSVGNIYDFAVDRGFHVYGGEIQMGNSGMQCEIYQGCPFQNNDEEHNTNCRWNTFDGMPHGDQNGDSPETGLSGKLKAALQELVANAPGEGWDYFLDGNGDVRWSDVGITGYSHGAQSAVMFAVKQCMWRAVARSGPRDNGCGTGAGGGDFDANNPPWNEACTGCISTWLNETPASPISHFYGFVGLGDVQYGDIMWAMDHMGFLGDPVNISTNDAGDSHRLYSGAGHDDFTGAQWNAAMQKAWSVPQENMDFAN